MTHIISHTKQGPADIVKIKKGVRLLDIAYELGWGSKSYLKRLFEQGAVENVDTGKIIRDYKTTT